VSASYVREVATTDRPVEPRFGYTVAASALHDRAAVDAVTADARELLTELGGSQHSPPGPHVFLVGTGGTERLVLDAVAQRHLDHPGEPVILVAHPGHNSLPAALETLAAVHQAGERGRIVFLTGDVGVDRMALDEAVGDLEAWHRLQTTRLGIVGGASSWLVASEPTAETVRRRWGPEVITIDPTPMIELTRTPVVPTGPLAERFTAVADPVVVADRDVHDAAAVRSALVDVLDEEGVDAVTVRCFDLLTDPGTSGCLALASLNDDGIVAGCEGDVPSALAMLWARHLLDAASWMANPSRVDAATNRLVLAHCTVAPSMVESYGLSTHFESGAGVGIGGRFAVQPVTLIRLGGADLDRCWIAEGDIVATGDDPDLCRTQVTIELSDGSVDDLLERPLGNHLVLVAGHHAARLRRWWHLVVAPAAPAVVAGQ